MPSARSTAARGVPGVTERLVVPSPRSISTTRADLRALKASPAETSRRAALSFFSIARWSRKASDEDVGLDAAVGAMIDRPQVDHVLEIGEGALDIGEVPLVETHRIESGQIGLFALDDVFAFIGPLAGEMDGMLEETEHAVRAAPVVVTMTMIARRSSEWTTNTRTPGWFDSSSCTNVLGADAFSRAVMPAGHSIHGPVALWM
jgi:hypothetical protein